MDIINPFDLLGIDDNDDPSHLIELHKEQIRKAAEAAAVAAAAAAAAAAEAAAAAAAEAKEREAALGKGARGRYSSKARDQSQSDRGGGRGGAGRGRGNRGNAPGRDFGSNGNVNGFSGDYNGVVGAVEDGDIRQPLERGRGYYDGPRQPYHGGQRDGYENGDGRGDFEQPNRRQYARQNGSSHGHDKISSDGAGHGNSSAATDEVFTQEPEEITKTEDQPLNSEKQVKQDELVVSDAGKDNKESVANEEEPEKEVMTLDEYQKLLEEKRKALLAMKAEERKVHFDKDFESMHQLSLKKGNDEIFIKLGSDKDGGKRKEDATRDEKSKKKPISISVCFKPADIPGGRRGRGRGDRWPSGGGFGARGDRLPSRGGFGARGDRLPSRGGQTSSTGPLPISNQVEFPSLKAEKK